MNLIIFNGIRNLMIMDRVCREKSVAVKVMPIPHTYSLECGMCLLVGDFDLARFCELASENKITINIVSNFNFE